MPYPITTLDTFHKRHLSPFYLKRVRIKGYGVKIIFQTIDNMSGLYVLGKSTFKKFLAFPRFE